MKKLVKMRIAQRFLGMGTLLLMMAALLTAAMDPSGEYKAVFVSQEGQTKESVLTLKIDSGAVSGSFVSPRGKVPIGGGSVQGNQITFFVVRKTNYDETKINFSGTIKGDTLKLKMQFGDRKPVLMTAKRT